MIYERLKEIGRITTRGSFIHYHSSDGSLDFKENGRLRFNEKFHTKEILEDAKLQYINSYKGDIKVNPPTESTDDDEVEIDQLEI